MERLKPLIDKAEIAAKIEMIARQIDLDYAHRDLVIIMVLKGAVCLVADLIRAIHLPCDIEVVQCQSYGVRGIHRGELKITGLELLQVEGRDCLIVDDIFDSGLTLTTLFHALQQKNPRSIKSLVLLSKQVQHVSNYRPDYVLFKIENEFVVGYGLDYKEYYRGLSGIFTLATEL